jgi:DNA polymerase-3 subunit epsilon
VVDANAAASLFLRLADVCPPGAPVSAPTGFARGARVYRRDDTLPMSFPEPPLIVFLASRLAHTGVDVSLLSYLELVGRAVADMHLDRSERQQLAELANGLGLSPAHVAQSHRRFVNDLIDAAIADNEVTADEYDMLVRIGSALGVDQNVIELRIRPYRANERAVRLTAGMTIVFTGDHRIYERSILGEFAAEAGLVVQHGVSKSTQLVAAADTQSGSGKAQKARSYGIPIVSVDDLLHAGWKGAVPTIGAQVALKVITCPVCLATWTVPATQAGATSKKCSDCSSVATQPAAPRLHKPRPAPGNPWAAPVVEWLTCARCGRGWHRQVTRGRKPRECPDCTHTAQLADPT